MQWIAVCVAAPCDDVDAAVTPLSKFISASITHSAAITVGAGSTVSVDWTINSLPSRDISSFFLSLYFIVSTPQPVRFEGLGFLALTKDASGPSQVSVGRGLSRAIVPLHNPVAARQGNIAVKPLRAGEIEVTWSLVAVTSCGEHVVAQEKSSTIPVLAGALRMVVQNLYDLESPDRIILSNDGKYRLHAFETRFRVFDVSTGALLIEAPGREPNFSPNSRFVAAYHGSRTGLYFDVFDLESGDLIAHPTGPALIWQSGDSVLVAASDRYERLQMLQTLVDTPPSPREKKLTMMSAT